MAVGMFGLILLPFVFTLLVILLVKAPKVGAVLVGAILFLGLAGRFLAFRGGVGVPGFMEVVIIMPFAFVLLVLMFSKAPKAATGVIVTILVAVLAGLVFLIPMHRRVAVEQSTGLRQFTESYSGAVPLVESYPVADPKAQPPVTSPIWSEGVEDEYEADVYPSRLAAVRALGTPLQQWIQQTVEDFNQPLDVVLFQEYHDRSVLLELKDAIENGPSGIRCSIELGSRNIGFDEIGVTLGGGDGEAQSDRRSDSTTGWMSANARIRDRDMTAVRDYTEKPWVEDFAGFANETPDRQFVVARSRGACTSENEAKRQAEQDACAQLLQRLEPLPPRAPGQPLKPVTPTELLEGGFVTDQFVQSFDGLSGRLWRQTLLIDVSPEKMVGLWDQMTAQMHVERITWAHMILSALGILVVIVATYLFLNMATRGYYVWSLRIAGTVLAIAGIVSIILVLR